MYSDAVSFAFGQPGTGDERTTGGGTPGPTETAATDSKREDVRGGLGLVCSLIEAADRALARAADRIARTTEPAARTSVRPASERRTRSRTKA
jgi:hypothetical protein